MLGKKISILLVSGGFLASFSLFQSCSKVPEPKGKVSSSVICLTSNASKKADDTSKLFLSADAPNWDDDIKKLADKGCAASGCHAAGDTDPALDTYNLFKADIIAVKDKYNGGHKNIKDRWTADEFALITKWETDKFPESAPLTTKDDAEAEGSAGPSTDDWAKVETLLGEGDSGLGCIGCHNAEDKTAGLSLATQDDYKANADVVLKYIKNGHKGAKDISDEDLKVFEDYNAALTAAESSSQKSAKKEDCVKGEGGDKTLAITEEHQKCNERGKIYHRSNKQCLEDTTINKSPCTWESVYKMFESDAEISKTLKAKQDDKYQIDQCGTSAGKPAVLITKVDGALFSSDFIGVQ